LKLRLLATICQRVQPHHDFSIHDMDALLSQADDLHRVPFTGRVLRVRLLDASTRLTRDLGDRTPLSRFLVAASRGGHFFWPHLNCKRAFATPH
jgi:hypothetical protein